MEILKNGKIIPMVGEPYEGDIAIENGKIQVGKELASLSLRHLLRMSTGQEKEPGGSDCWDDMVSAFLREPFHEMPGEVFRYNSIATYMLSASLKKKGELDNKTYNYSNISRVIRTQVFNNPNFTPHFTVLALISCGRDTGSFNFEKEELLKHLTTSYEICKSYGVEKIYYEIIPCKGYDSQSPLIMESISYVREKNSNLEVLVIAPEHDNNYYHGFRIKQQIVIGGNTIEIADGGLLDWTQQLLTNKKERMMTFGLGIQVLYHLTK